jgi:hypothetical protein
MKGMKMRGKIKKEENVTGHPEQILILLTKKQLL